MSGNDQKIGMLGGGNMAGALVRGLLAAGTATPERLRVSEPQEERRRALQAAHGIETTASNADLVRWADVVVVAVKPQIVAGVLDAVGAELAGKLVISIVAGATTELFAARVAPTARIIRTMPNTPAIALAGATAIAAGPRATPADLALAQRLFDAVGKTVVVGEALLDAVTGLSGSGPAYVLLFIEALADGGVKAGLPRDVALTLAAQTVRGTAQLLVELGEHPARLKDMVTSPGGTTITGLAELERGGVRYACMSAVAAATERSAELGRAAGK